MIWTALAILIIICLVIYYKRKNSVNLRPTKDQVELVQRLIHKERNVIEEKRQNIIDSAAANGKTIPLESLFANIQDEPESVKHEIEGIKKDLLKKYGENIPVDSVYRLMKQFDPDEKSIWSDNPGCFERHLQRREGNILFPPERRIISKKEIKDAQQKDRIEQEQFAKKINSFIERTKTIDENIPPNQASSILQEVQNLIEEAAEIGGAIESYIQVLENTENNIIESLNRAVPDGADLLKQAQSLSMLKRSPYIAQISRKDSPIHKDEEIPTLLSEDLETIALEGYKSRAFAPDYRPNEAEIRKYLKDAVNRGFSKEAADKIISAWNET
jgi:uncharacterized protein YoxC